VNTIERRHTQLMHRRQALRLLCGLPIVLAACASSTGSQAPEINYGYDTCANCGMLIMDNRYAAATTLKNGEVRKFDNVADMIAFHHEHPDQDVERWWAHDYQTQQWLDALQSHYVLVQGKDTCSSLQKDILAFASSDSAKAMADEHTVTPTNWDGVRQVVFAGEHNSVS